MDGSGEVQKKAVVKDLPAIGLSMNWQLDQNRGIVFQTHVGQDVSPAELNATLDKLALAADRQQAKYQLEALQSGLEKQEVTLGKLKGDLERLDGDAQALWEASPKRGPYKETQQTKIAKRQAAAQIEVFEREIARFKEQIAECEAKIKG